MTSQTIKCPRCQNTIELNEAFSAQVKTQVEEQLRQEYNKKFKDELLKREEKIKKEKDEELQNSLKDLEVNLRSKEDRLKEAQQREIELLQKKRELEDREQVLRLEMERKLTDERQKISDDARSRVLEEIRLKDAEKDKHIADLRKQIDELSRRAGQGSQQAQGEIMEVELEQWLRSEFPHDDIKPVPKGIRGADVIQEVFSRAGQKCGSILWESKRTKTWSDQWIQKLKDDQREIKSNVAVIVSAALPKEIAFIGNVEGIWVSDFSTAMGLASVLRAGMIEVSQTRTALIGKNEKMELLYSYLSGPEFRQRIEAVVETFSGMKADLDTEKRAMDRLWQKREKQIERVIQNTTRLYGELEGIMGISLPVVSTLELPLEDPDEQN
ncbi:MAG: DUF2130 domain-containing protein [Bacteroidetes bacterium]|nr:DUF2130 domain-containing protein [Bacteroidota bacterium]